MACSTCTSTRSPLPSPRPSRTDTSFDPAVEVPDLLARARALTEEHFRVVLFGHTHLAKQVTLVAAKALPLASVRTAGTENEPRTRRLRALNFVSVVSDCRSMDSLIRKYRDASKHRA